MDEIISTPPIMTVTEFRRLTGDTTKYLSDEEVAQCITHLDLLAGIFVQEQVKRKENEKEKQEKKLVNRDVPKST